MVHPSGTNSPYSGSGSPIELSSHPGSHPVSRTGSPEFFDFDRNKAPKASFSSPLIHPQFPRKNFETESN
jgi:hypothetical protein